jgi:hypothetical protein
MRRQSALLVALAALAAPVSVTSAQSATTSTAGALAAHVVLAQLPPDSLVRARRYATWLLTARSDSLYASLDSTSRRQFGSVSVFDDIAADLAIRAGAEEHVVQERWVNRLGKRQYWRTSKYSAADEPMMVRFVILPTGELAGIGVNLQSQAPPTDP